MTPELRFEHRFADLYHVKYGGKSYHADFLAPGFPDRIFYPFGAESQLVEFKVCYSLDDACSKVFQPTQPSFYADFLRDETKRIFVAIEVKKNSSYAAFEVNQLLAVHLHEVSLRIAMMNANGAIEFGSLLDVVEWVFSGGNIDGT